MRGRTGFWKGPEQGGVGEEALGLQETEGPRDLVKTGECHVKWEIEEHGSKESL